MESSFSIKSPHLSYRA